MKQIGVYDAKTHLTKLLDEVERGEIITITRHGKPVAKLVPFATPRKDVAAVIAAIRESRKGRTLGGISPKELINEGRKY